MKAPQKSLKDWTKQKWRTKSGKPSSKTGERYLPEAAIKSLSSAEYAATTKAKREGKAKGKQFVKQPKKIAQKTRKFRANEGGVAMTKDNKKPMAFAETAGKSKTKEKLEKMDKNGLINFIMDLKNKMKTGEDKIPERLKANKGGMMKKKGYAAGGLKTPGANQKGLKKLPKAVRNKMGYMNKGGMPKKKGYAKGGKMNDMRKTGMFYGGMSRRGK